MKALIRVIRRTEYASTVDMTEEKFEVLRSALNGGDRQREMKASRELNKLIDTRDWQDDDLDCIEDFERVVEPDRKP